MCRKSVWRFLPYEGGWTRAPPLLAALEVVGSDLDHFECPRCGAHDRERHLLLYMDAAGLLDELPGKVVVHFAPEKELSQQITRRGPANYLRYDLSPSAPGVERQDIMAMTLPSDFADLVIANHVLEHVADDRKALDEVRRVLKPGGLAILQTPFSAVLKSTWEDSGVSTEVARLQAFGQSDHVRLFGRNFVERVVAAGFISRVKSHSELLPKVDPRRSGVNLREPFLLFENAPASQAAVGRG